MSATTWIAVYAALIATSDVVWQIAGWYLAQRTRLSVTATYVPHIPTITVKIVNRSAHDVRVGSITLVWEHEEGRGVRMLVPRNTLPSEGSAADGAADVILRAMSDLPDVIRPRDAGTAFVGGKRLRAALPTGATNIRALVGTADGKVAVATAKILGERPASPGQ